jgi:hypothetical protein
VIEVDSRYMHIPRRDGEPGTHTPDCEKLVLPTAYWQVGAKCTSDVPATE